VEPGALDGRAEEVGDRHRVGSDQHDLVLAQFDGVAGVLDERADVAGEVVLAAAAAHDERGVAARADDRPGRLAVDGQQGECALEPLAHAPHGLGEALGRIGGGVQRREFGGDEVCGALGVGLAGELHATGLKLGPQPGEVLQDTVVDHRHPTVGRAVGVRVAVVRGAVRGPPGVSDTRHPLRQAGHHAALGQRFLQVGQLARAFLGEQRAGSVQNGHPGRVVPAVLQAAQPVDHDVQRRTAAGVPHDPTHGQHRSTPIKHLQ
jgi:hypothetical protein